MQLFEISQTGEAMLALVIVGVMFLLFMREQYPAEVVAITGAAAMLALGLLPYEAALNVLSNPAPWTIGAMFIVMGALVPFPVTRMPDATTLTCWRCMPMSMKVVNNYRSGP